MLNKGEKPTKMALIINHKLKTRLKNENWFIKEKYFVNEACEIFTKGLENNLMKVQHT